MGTHTIVNETQSRSDWGFELRYSMGYTIILFEIYSFHFKESESLRKSCMPLKNTRVGCKVNEMEINNKMLRFVITFIV